MVDVEFPDDASTPQFKRVLHKPLTGVGIRPSEQLLVQVADRTTLAKQRDAEVVGVVVALNTEPATDHPVPHHYPIGTALDARFEVEDRLRMPMPTVHAGEGRLEAVMHCGHRGHVLALVGDRPLR